MTNIYQHIVTSAKNGEKLLAVLIDPDKMKLPRVPSFMAKVNQSIATHVFVGGSEVHKDATQLIVEAIKKHTTLPVVLFPGDKLQITDKADSILFLSLISGRNPEYLIGQHVDVVSKLKTTDLEIIPTGYILIENGKQTAVELVSNTKPIKRLDLELIKNTAIAGEFLGFKLIYLEAGSGATRAIEPHIISSVKRQLNIPLIVGGGIRTKSAMDEAYNAGADLVVIGTAFEDNEAFFEDLKMN